MSKYFNLNDYCNAASQCLSPSVNNYYRAGSDDMVTVNDNESSYKRIGLIPRVLRDVSIYDTQVTLLREYPDSCVTLSHPILAASTSLQKLAHEGGEIESVKGVIDAGSLFIASQLANTSLEDIASACIDKRRLWMQMYLMKERDETMRLIRRAEIAGYRALVITVDAPVIGNRETDQKDELFFPNGITMPNVSHILEKKYADIDHVSALTQYLSLGLAESVTWDDIDWLKNVTSLPIILKGIMHPLDAILAHEHGVAGIIVSNHGGRQCDTTISTIDALGPIVHALKYRGSKMDILVDGGIRRGTDVLKCLAMGANAVLVGRPILWGLAVNGSSGVKHVISLLANEMTVNMRLCGYDSVSSLMENGYHILAPKTITL